MPFSLESECKCLELSSLVFLLSTCKGGDCPKDVTLTASRVSTDSVEPPVITRVGYSMFSSLCNERDCMFLANVRQRQSR